MAKRSSKFARWSGYSVFFLCCFSAGLLTVSSNFQNNGIAVSDYSSVSEKTDLTETNYPEMQKISDDELLRQLEQSPVVEDENSYALTPEQIELVDQKIYHREENEGVKYQQIADDTVNTQYENPNDPKVCSGGRLFYENKITANPKLKDLYTARDDNPALPKKCITHIMNKMNLGRASLGICESATGKVKLAGAKASSAKPCVTENLVNMTYNSFVDVMECLNLNPKLFLPKIARESGFLLNAYGAGKDGGIGQFTKPAIEDVNQDFNDYMSEIEKAAATKPSCARIMKYKSMLKKASSASEQRCAMIGLPENPLRNILYIGIFNKSNMDRFAGVKYIAGADFIAHGAQLVPTFNDSRDEFEGTARANGYKEALESLGIKNPNMHLFKEILTLAGYNIGSPTALRVFSLYLQKRKAAHKPLTMEDFDFNKVRMIDDVYGDGTKKNSIDIARSYVMSSFISRKDKPQARAIKLKKRKQLPNEWAASYLKPFPEFLAMNANAYNGKQIGSYAVYGDPGYLSFVAGKNRDLREVFNGAGIDPDYCSDPNFLTTSDR